MTRETLQLYQDAEFNKRIRKAYDEGCDDVKKVIKTIWPDIIEPDPPTFKVGERVVLNVNKKLKGINLGNSKEAYGIYQQANNYEIKNKHLLVIAWYAGTSNHVIIGCQKPEALSTNSYHNPTA